MARLTIEEKWWSDPRRERLAKLTGSMEMADAAALRAWRLAMEFWGHSHGLIPLEIFNTLETAPKLIEAGLAKVEGDMIYVRGSSQYLSWLHEKRLAAVTAGRISAQRPRDSKGWLLPKKARKPSNKTPTTIQRESNETPTPASEVQPFGFGLGLGSDSKTEESFPSEMSEVASAPRAPAVQEFIASYCEAFKGRYGTNPPMMGKAAGISKRLVTDIGAARACELVRTYLAMNDQFFVLRRHDLATFESNLNAVAVKLDTGRSVTRHEAQQGESQDFYPNQMDKI